MKKLSFVALASALFVLPAFAGQHTSSFGLTLTLPDGWTAYGKQEVKANPDLLNFDKPGLSKADPNLIRQIKAKVEAGQLEMFMHDGVGNDSLTDNVNIIKEAGAIPNTKEDLKKMCADLPGEFSSYFGHPVDLYQCDLTTVAGKDAMLIEFDGALQGSRSIQYQIESAAGVTVIITGTFTNETLEQERSVFLGIVRSIKFH